MDDFSQIRTLLHEKADIQTRINLIPYDGSPEIKNRNGKQYLYIRKRAGGKNTSTYVGEYSETLYQLLLKNAKELRDLRKSLRKIDAKLLVLGYTDSELPPRVIQNIDFARANMKSNIYDQAVLEGVAASFPQTEDIIDNGIISGMKASDIQKILNLKHAWEFILDKDVVQSKSDYYLLCHIARLVNGGFFYDGGQIRGVPLTIGGSSYAPPLPVEFDVKEHISAITGNTNRDKVDIGIELCLYCMKTQIFMDGNKRASVIFANHFFVSNGLGFLVIPEKAVADFKKLLVRFYEGENISVISDFMKNICWKTF